MSPRPFFPLLEIGARLLGWMVLALVAGTPVRGAESAPTASLIVVCGAGGEKDYDEAFAAWAENWRAAGTQAGARVVTIGGTEKPGADLEAMRAALAQESPVGTEPLWVVLLGHGTSDGQAAKFNLRGEDLTAAELAEWLAPLRRPVVVVAAFSASGAFLAPLSSAGRVLVVATKSGTEVNYARFGKFLSLAIGDPAADLDHDGQTSVLEAWLRAARLTEEFYASEGRLATEHALLDDNGDGRGTPASWFRGLRLIKKTSDTAVPDGARAHQIHLLASPRERDLSPEQRAERNALELELAALRESKSDLAEDQYYARLEALLRRLARVYRGTKSGARD